MSSFADFLSLSFGKNAASCAEDFLGRFDFPVPEDGEFYSTNPHSGKLSKLILFAPSYGIAFRFYEPYQVPVHDKVLQPLAKIETNAAMDIDIVGLVEPGISASDLAILRKELDHDSLEWADFAEHNAGYLDVSGQRHVVIIDICESLQDQSFNINFTPKAKETRSCKVQSGAFGHLNKLAENWNDETSFPDRKEAGQFLQNCRETMGYVSLRKNFEKVKDDGQTLKAVQASELYGRRLSVMPQAYCAPAYVATMRNG